MHRLIDRLGRELRTFQASRDANVAMLFALTLIPLLGVVGVAIDYNRAITVRAAMQAALDSTAFAMSKSAAGMSEGELLVKANEYFDALFNRPEAPEVTISTDYSLVDNAYSLSISGSGSVQTSFMGLLGIDAMNLNANSVVRWGVGKLRVALVLDNTKSMADSDRIGKLKAAAENLLTFLESSAQTPEAIEVAIVPFADSVNVGTSNVDASWLDWSCYNNTGTVNHADCTVVGGGVPDKTLWDGCVMDRDQNYDVTNAEPTAAVETMFRAIYTTRCPESLMPLSHDWAALHTKIDALTASGSAPLAGTNNTIGLAWGWQALTPGAPLDGPMPDVNTNRVIIQMTDGQNTDNRWSSSGAEVDVRMAMACENVKADNVTLYMVVVEAGDSTVMRNCANDEDKYFPLTSADQLNAAFGAIGENLASLFLAQ